MSRTMPSPKRSPKRSDAETSCATKVQRRTSGSAPRDIYEVPHEASELFDALRRLSPNQRAAVVLHHYAGYPVKDIASMIGSTPPAVRVHLSVGRKRLRTLLEESHG